MPTFTPRTWTPGEIVTAALLNTELRDALNTLKDPPTAHFEADQVSDYTTTSTIFTDVDNTAGRFNLTIETTGGDVMVGFIGSVRISTTTGDDNVWFNIMVDANDLIPDDGFAVYSPQDAYVVPVGFVYLVTDLSAGSHSFKLRWKVISGRTATLYAGAGTANFNVHPQFWVREVS